MNSITKRKYLYQHNSTETSKLVEDYPWGFRLRTTIRYWIETKKSQGQRFCSQTINPKTGKWCAPKYSTYSPIIIMFLDENEHVKYLTLNHNSGEEAILRFKEIHLDYLNEFQKEQLKEIIAYTNVMKNVTFKCECSPVGPVSLFSRDPEEIEKRKKLAQEYEEREKKQKESLRQINIGIAHEIKKIKF